MDMITLYYDKRDKGKFRAYFKSLDELFIHKQRYELVGMSIIPSWLGVKNVEI